MTDREATHADILNHARTLAHDSAPVYASALAPASVSGGVLGGAREMFLNIFVNQALDQLSATLESDKEAIAEAAASFARSGVEALENGVNRVKLAVGLPPTPGS